MGHAVLEISYDICTDQRENFCLNFSGIFRVFQFRCVKEKFSDFFRGFKTSTRKAEAPSIGYEGTGTYNKRISSKKPIEKIEPFFTER